MHGRIDIVGENLSEVRVAHLKWAGAVESEQVRRRWHTCICSAQLGIRKRIRDSACKERQEMFERSAVVVDQVHPRAVRANCSPVVDHGIERRAVKDMPMSAAFLFSGI